MGFSGRKSQGILDQARSIAGGTLVLEELSGMEDAAAVKRFKRDGGMMVLYNIPPLVQQVLDLLSLRSVLTLTTDERAATALAKGEKP